MKHIRIRLIIFLAGILFGNLQYCFAQVDNYQKNTNTSQEAEAAYNKDLEKNPNSALPTGNMQMLWQEFKLEIIPLIDYTDNEEISKG